MTTDRPGRRQIAADYWQRHPFVDLVVGALLAIAYGVTQIRTGEDALSRLGQDGVFWVYSTVAMSASAILGFGVTAIAIFMAITPGARFRYLLSKRVDAVNTIFISTVWALAALVAIAIVALALSSLSISKWVYFVFYGAVVVAFLRTGRFIWLFSQLVRIASRDAAEGTQRAEDTPTNLQ